MRIMSNRHLLLSASNKGFFFASLFIFIWLLTVLIVWAPLYYYVETVVEKMRQQTANTLKFYANMHGNLANELSPMFLKYIFGEIIAQTDIPIINTDANKTPQYWEGLSIDQDDKSPEAIEKVQKIVKNLEGEIDPIPLIYKNPATEAETVLGYLYYGDSELITQLRYLPYIEIIVVNIFIIIGLFGSYLVFKSIQKSEQRSIWVGMSKETAHQLGTPLSSLMGWLEIIKSNEHECELTRKTIVEMEKDVNRLYKVADRFSQIGSKPDFTAQDVRPILREVATYIRRRLPHMRKEVKIIENYKNVSPIPINRELFEWVIENLLKNSIDAIKSEKGQILIKLEQFKNDSSKICLDIKDNGIGIQAINKNVIFKPGYSTKKRGWGLGLNLAQRIVEEYHNGKLFIKESKVGEGTTMRIIL